MEEKSGLDKLLENLAKFDLVPDVTIVDKGTLLAPQNRFAHSHTVTALLSDSIYFVARSNVSSSFTGIYSSINLPEEAEYNVFKRNWFDFLFFPKRQKLGVKFTDEQLTIVSSRWVPSKELNSENVHLFLAANKTGRSYNLVVGNNYLSSIMEPLTDRKVIGLETNDWLHGAEDLENLLKIGEELIRNIKHACG